MSARLFVVILAAGLMVLFVSTCGAQESLPPEETLASVAHSHGVRGGDLAEALGLPRATDKHKPLVEMGITPERLNSALLELGVHSEELRGLTSRSNINTSMTIRQVASILEINGKTLAHDLGLDVEVGKDTPIKEFGVTRQKLNGAIAHILSHEEEGWDYLKYPGYLLISLFAMIFLLRWGIPKNADPKKRKSYYPQKIYIIVLIIVVAILGFALGKSPNPMEGAVKFFKATVGLYDEVLPKLLLMLFFLACAVIANKVICGWGCPFGALEELIYLLPLFKKAKKKKFPFWVSNAIRAGFFVFFLVTLYGIVGGQKGIVYYHYLNPFNLFNVDFSTWTIPVAIAIYLIISFFFYRPFCRFICPFGFLSWIAEQVSLTRVRIDFERCIDCKACAKACPVNAAADRLKRKKLPEDCFSCMRCLRVCPSDAIHYRQCWGPPSPRNRNS